MADRILASNDGPGKGYTSDLHFFTYNVSGDITATQTAKALLYVPAALAGRIVSAVLAVGNTGTDASNALSIEADVLVNAVSIFSTKPAITKAAADGANTSAAGTGITVGVIDTAADDVASGELVTVTLTLTRTASPSDEMADIYVTVGIAPAAA
jgi:hypothetical protein